jgi:hypothetical protein
MQAGCDKHVLDKRRGWNCLNDSGRPFLVYWISILESFADKQFSATACWPSSGIKMSVKRR